MFLDLIDLKLLDFRENEKFKGNEKIKINFIKLSE